MTYTAFDGSKPDPSTQAGTAFGSSARANLLALRDMLAAAGAMPGWALTPAGGSAEEPATLTWSKGAERIRQTLTWSAGKVTKLRYEYSSNGGSSWDNLADDAGNSYQNITYDAADNVTAIAWGTS